MIADYADMKREGFSPELQVVLECARFGGARADYLRSLLQGVEPKQLAETAIAHHVAPLCYQQISLLDPPIESDVIDPLKLAWLGGMYAGTLTARELCRLIDRFDSAGIPVIPFKGLTLADSAYGDICLRQVGDIDVLIRSSDLWEVQELLVSLGYRPAQQFSALQEEHHVRNDCALYFRPPDPPPFLDVQWRFAPKYVPIRFDYSSWFDFPPRVTFQGRVIRSIPRDQLLLYLVLHGALHTWCKVVHFADVVKYLESHEDWNWASLVGQAREAGLANAFSAGLRLCSELLDWPRPPEVYEHWKKSVSTRRISSKTLCRLRLKEGQQAGTISTLTFTFQILDRRFGRLFNYAFKRALLPSASDWRFLRIPDRFYFLYYPLRLIRFAWLAVRALKPTHGNPPTDLPGEPTKADSKQRNQPGD